MKQYWTEEKIKSAKYDELKKRAEEAEGELAIIKGAQVIQLQADNEVRKFTKRIADLEDINKSHQKLNGELRKELTYINKKYVDSLKKLADQKDLVKTYRKAGIL